MEVPFLLPLKESAYPLPIDGKIPMESPFSVHSLVIATKREIKSENKEIGLEIL